MRDQRLMGNLKRLHGEKAQTTPRPDHRDELESRLLARYRDRKSRTRRWLMLLNPWNRNARFAIVGLALMVLGVGACTTPTTTEVDMGRMITISLTEKTMTDIETIDAGLTRYLDANPGIEDVSVRIMETTDGQAAIEIQAWGQHLDEEALAADMRRQIPGLQGASITFEPLTGMLEESFASHLRREIFDLEVEGATAEEIRAKIMEQLAERGLDEGAEVEVIQEDGLTEIKMTVEQEVGDGE